MLWFPNFLCLGSALLEQCSEGWKALSSWGSVRRGARLCPPGAVLGGVEGSALLGQYSEG